MPVKSKNAARSKAAKPQHRRGAARREAELRSGTVQEHDCEPIAVRTRKKTARARAIEAFIKMFAKEDAKIIAKASARALRRGLH